MSAATLEREMNAGIHHIRYRVIPAGFARGFFVGICKECPPTERYHSTKTSTHNAEKAVIAHLKDKHGIDPEEEST